MDWIPLYRSLAGHPKTRRLARLTKTTVPCIVGHLSLLWSWAVDYAPDGNLSRFESAEVADACMWDVDDADSFCAALRESGFVDDDDTLHDWPDYTGAFVAKRAVNAERMRRARAGNEERASTVRARAMHVQPDDVPGAPLEGKEQNRTEPKTLARNNGGRADGTDGETTRGALGAAPGGSSPSVPEPPGFAKWYAVYPLHQGRGAAAKAYRNARRRADADVLLDAVVRYAADPNLPTDRSKIPYPQRWLNESRWLDDPLPAQLAAVGGRFHRDDPLPPEVS